ncbi:MAG TPA: hypothetical protein H9987_10185 [Candidatus Luteococcus avicola]|nr:hypothetical protein [Candidatus Luteococcus avicola]
MTDLEELLKQTLNDQASRVEDPDPTTRAQQVIRTAHTSNGTRRRLVALGLGLTLLTGLGLAGRQLASDEGEAAPRWMATPSEPPSRASELPTSSPSASGTASSTSAAASVSPTTASAGSSYPLPTPSLPAGTSADAAIGKLPTGSAAQYTPRVAVGKILLPDGGSAALPSGASDIAQVLPVSDGWVVRTMSKEFTGGGPDTASEVLLVRRNGTVAQLAPAGANTNLALDRTGTRLAWVRATTDAAILHVMTLSGTEGSGTTLPTTAHSLVPSTLAVQAWAKSGIFLSGNVTTSENSSLWIADPSSGELIAARTLREIWQVGPGTTIQVSTTKGEDCAALVRPGQEDHQLVCAPDVLIFPGRSGGAWVEGRDQTSSSQPAEVLGAFVSPEGSASSVSRPGWLEFSDWAFEDGRTDSVLLSQLGGEAVAKQTWLRWDLAGARLEKVSLR